MGCRESEREPFGEGQNFPIGRLQSREVGRQGRAHQLGDDVGEARFGILGAGAITRQARLRQARQRARLFEKHGAGFEVFGKPRVKDFDRDLFAGADFRAVIDVGKRAVLDSRADLIDVVEDAAAQDAVGNDARLRHRLVECARTLRQHSSSLYRYAASRPLGRDRRAIRGGKLAIKPEGLPLRAAAIRREFAMRCQGCVKHGWA